MQNQVVKYRFQGSIIDSLYIKPKESEMMVQCKLKKLKFKNGISQKIRQSQLHRKVYIATRYNAYLEIVCE